MNTLPLWVLPVWFGIAIVLMVVWCLMCRDVEPAGDVRAVGETRAEALEECALVCLLWPVWATCLIAAFLVLGLFRALGLIKLEWIHNWLFAEAEAVGRYRCVHYRCDAEFDDPDEARAHERGRKDHWITDEDRRIRHPRSSRRRRRGTGDAEVKIRDLDDEEAE